MRFLCLVASFVISAVLAGGPASARTITAVDHPVKGDPAAAALSFVRANLHLFGASPALERTLGVDRQTRLPAGVAVHIGQRLGALRVIDAGVNVLVLAGKIIAVSGELAAVEPSSRLPSVDRAEAAAMLAAVFPGARVRRAELALLPRRGVAARRVWVLDALTVRPFGIYEVWIDAESGEFLGSRLAMQHATGKAYGTNPAVSSLAVVDLFGLQGDGQQLLGEHADVSSCTISWSQEGSSDCQRYAKPDADGNFLFEPDEPSLEDPFAEVHAYYHVDRIHRWFNKTFGFTRKGDSQQIQVTVNTSFEGRDGDLRGMYNAMFADMNGDGKGELILGQGKIDFAYDADVVYHEFSHSVMDSLVNLEPGVDGIGLNLAPLAISEGYADIFAAIISGDPVIGEYAGGGNAIRTLVGAARCPDALIGESHTDGLLWGETAWSIRSKLSAAERASFDGVLYQTIAGLGTAPSFSDLAALLLKVTQTVAPALETAVQAELTARNLLDCSRIIPLSSTTPREVYVLGSRSLGLGFAPAAYQYSVKVPENAEKLQLDVSYEYDLRGESGAGLFIRKGEPVGYDVRVTHDLAMSNPELSFSMEVGHAERPLEPGATYYVLPVNVARRDAVFTLAVTITEAELPEPDAGVDAAEPDAGVDAALPDAAVDAGEPDDGASESGCSCDLGTRPDSTCLLLLGLLLGALSFRRRG